MITTPLRATIPITWSNCLRVHFMPRVIFKALSAGWNPYKKSYAHLMAKRVKQISQKAK